MSTSTKLAKILTIPCLALLLGFSQIAIAGETGVVEPKDTIEDRGPGNLDVPLEPTPEAKPSDAEKKKEAEQPGEKAEDKAKEKTETPK